MKKPKPAEPANHYRVQVGYFSSKENADRLTAELKALGFDAIIKEENV